MNKYIANWLSDKIRQITPILFLLSFGNPIDGWSQINMDQGFTLLENGAYEEAIHFFEEVLMDSPEDKTALICLGRARGLGGAPAAAITIFEELLASYPEDPEVLLNIAEAQLWNSSPEEAIRFYDQILDREPDNTTALQGKANALSLLKRYDQAVLYIDRAVKLAPDNPQIRISRKFTYLAQADQLRQQGQIDQSHQLIDTVLLYFPNDEQALFDKATSYMFEQKYKQARSLYQVLNEKSDQKVRIMSGLSYLNSILAEKEDFLRYADSALYYQQRMADSVSFQLLTNKARALTMNNRQDEAHLFLDSLRTLYPEVPALGITKNQLYLWAGDRDRALTGYQLLYQDDSLSIEITAGLAEAYNAVGRKRSASKMAAYSAGQHPANPDIKRFAQKLEMETSPSLEASYLFSSDKGGNEATAYKSSFGGQIMDNMNASFKLANRTVENTNEGSKLSRRTIGLQSQWQVNGSYTIGGLLQTDRIEIEEGTYTQNWSGLISLKWAPGKIHSLEGSYRTTFMDYNPILLSQKIRMTDYIFTYHAYTHSRFGTYNQVIITRQSDQNNRALYFGSFYYNLRTYPVIQLGLNYSTFSYSLNRPEVYFSPERFQAAEAMIKIDNAPVQGTKFRYLLTVASGYQFIEDNQAQWTLRAEGKLSYELSPRMSINLNYLYSNAANSTAAGFTFNQLEAGFKVIF